MKLQEGQVWKQGDTFLRIVHWERLAIQYKAMKNLGTKEGTLHQVTKKEFCRLLKGAVLLSEEDIQALKEGREGQKKTPDAEGGGDGQDDGQHAAA